MDTKILPPERPVVKGGAVTATVDAGTSRHVEITFDEPFLAVPYVTATITGGTGLAVDSVKLNVEAYSITETGFTLGLYNVTSRQINMKADWIAVLP